MQILCPLVRTSRVAIRRWSTTPRSRSLVACGVAPKLGLSIALCNGIDPSSYRSSMPPHRRTSTPPVHPRRPPLGEWVNCTDYRYRSMRTLGFVGLESSSFRNPRSHIPLPTPVGQRSTSPMSPQATRKSTALRSKAALTIARGNHDRMERCSTSLYYDEGRGCVVQTFRMVDSRHRLLIHSAHCRCRRLCRRAFRLVDTSWLIN